jgi:hypothetical protein
MLNLEWCISIWVLENTNLYKKDQMTSFFITIASCEVDLHWLSCFAMWITFMIWRLLETMFSILLYQLKSIGPKLDTNHEISSRIFSYFAPQWFIWHNFFCVTNITFVIITLRKHSTRNLIYKLLNLH